MAGQRNTFGARTTLTVGGRSYTYYRLGALAEQGVADVSRLPVSIRVLIEAGLRTENGHEVTREDVLNLARYNPTAPGEVEIPFLPARVLLQDFTGVPCVVDLAAMRAAMARLGGDPEKINPLVPVDLVIDHSVQVDSFGSKDALDKNVEIEYRRNGERYRFLRWGQQAFQNFRVVPPSGGIVHQVNLEYLAKGVQQGADGADTVLYPDSLVGTDSHTTMINGLGILGWGVGGIEAEAVMLGQPLSMLLPEVVGFRLTGRLPEGATATDLVLTVTQILRKKGVVGKFVEFFGAGLDNLSLPDRATIANMAPEYGATCGFFPLDAEALRYLRTSGRSEDDIALAEAYARAQGIFRTAETPDPVFTSVVELDLGTIVPSLAGPKRPQDRIDLTAMKSVWTNALTAPVEKNGFGVAADAAGARVALDAPYTGESLGHGDVVIAAITSCTNTSNPSVMLGAALLAKKAVEAGLSVRPKVKTSLAPGSQVVTAYLEKTGLLPYLEALGFSVVGYGCTTCIGNSGPLPEAVENAIGTGRLVAASVLSGNRNFEGRVHPAVKANYLASPPLVVAYAIAGTVNIDLAAEPVGTSRDGRPVYLKDIWPTSAEIAAAEATALGAEMFREKYHGIETANERWNAIPVPTGRLYQFEGDSTYIQEPPFFDGLTLQPGTITPIAGARVLAKLGVSVTTDHISPAGSIKKDSPAGRYLIGHGVAPSDFNSYGSRRGNDRVMTRGTFANVRLKNLLVPGTEGGVTKLHTTGAVTSIFDAAEAYKAAGVPTIVIAGGDYGMGSSRDWAAKGTMLLGVRAVIAESFERIHRSNLVGMGVLPLQFKAGETADTLGLTGDETYDVHVDETLAPRRTVNITVTSADGTKRTIEALCRIDTPVELGYYRNGGILQTVLRRLASN